MLRGKKCIIKTVTVLLKKIWTIVLTVNILQEKETIFFVYNIITASTFNDKIQYPFY